MGREPGDHSFMDGKHVAFGEVVKGMEVLESLEQYGTSIGMVTANIIISNCGMVGPDGQPMEGRGSVVIEDGAHFFSVPRTPPQVLSSLPSLVPRRGTQDSVTSGSSSSCLPSCPPPPPPAS